MIHYAVFYETINDPELGAYGAYGIAASDSGSETRVIRDVTCEEEKAKRLADVFNEEQLSLSQLDEAIENFLYRFEV